MNNKIIDISGIGHSGKTIVNDILKHDERIHVHPSLFEFNLLRVYGGLINLRSNLVDNWSPIRCDMAINQFKHLIKTISPSAKITNSRSMLVSNGWNYNDMLECDFENISGEYINSIIDFNAKSIWPFPEIYQNAFIRFLRKINYRLFKYKKKHNLLFSSGSNFDAITKLYLEKVLFNHGKNIVCTNNMFEPYNPGKYFNFFDNPFLILVWRDPRDIYVSTKVGDMHMPSDEKNYGITKLHKSFTLSDNVNNFVKRQRILLSQCSFENTNRILNLKFEDIVYNFENSVKEIGDLLKIDLNDIDNIRKKVNPEDSKKNIGMWKNYQNQDEIDFIKTELNDYMSKFGYK